MSACSIQICERKIAITVLCVYVHVYVCVGSLFVVDCSLFGVRFGVAEEDVSCVHVSHVANRKIESNGRR